AARVMTAAHIKNVALAVAVAICGSCDSRNTVDQRSAPPPSDRGQTAVRPQSDHVQKAESGRPRIVILGDSLTAGLGLPVEQAYPNVLQRRLNEAGLTFDVVNAGVSGDTSAGGLSRLDWSLRGDVRMPVGALGGNDA